MRLVFLVACFSLAFATQGQAQQSGFKSQGLELAVSTRKAEQLSAFYSARGLPSDAIDLITQYCFISVGLRNNRNDVVWLELDKWRIVDVNGKLIPRVTRKAWEKNFVELAVPAASRATFGWTLLPEVRDLLPSEPVGGNIAVAAPPEPFTLYADFFTGKKKTGPPLTVKISNLKCER